MKILHCFFIALALTAISPIAWCQEFPNPPAPPPPIAEEPMEMIYDFVEVQAEYPGGAQGLNEFIFRNVKYPQEAKEAEIEGRVYVQFVVEKDGTVSNVKVVRGISGGEILNKEAIRLVKLLQYDKPAYQGGKPVRSKATLPITFKLKV